MNHREERAEAIFRQAEDLHHEDAIHGHLKPSEIRLIVTSLLGGMNDAVTALERTADAQERIAAALEAAAKPESPKSIGYYLQKAEIEADEIDDGEGRERRAFSILRSIIQNKVPGAKLPSDVTARYTASDLVELLELNDRFEGCYPDADEEEIYDLACDTVNHLVDVGFWEQ